MINAWIPLLKRNPGMILYALLVWLAMNSSLKRSLVLLLSISCFRFSRCVDQDDSSENALKYLNFLNTLINETSKEPNSLRLFGDPDEGRTSQQLIKSRGFKSETYYVQTGDDYILALIRIVNPNDASEKKRPVLLQHGIQVSSQCWINNSPGGGIDDPKIDDNKPGNNLGFELAKRGYDVWLGNSRGTTYSRNHTRLDPKSRKFWNFTLDEMIEYDMPAVIDYILEKTGQTTLAYVGHSQGSAIMLGLLSSQSRYNEIIKPFIALAPVFLVGNGTSTRLIRSATSNKAINHLFFDRGGKFIDDNAFRLMIRSVCQGPFVSQACFAVFQPLLGKENFDEVDSSRLAVYFGSDSLGESTKNIQHWIDNFHRQKTERMHFMSDYGCPGNSRLYGQETPPFYDLSKLTNQHVYLIYSEADGLVGPRDVDDLVQAMTSTRPVMKHLIPEKKFSHVDFLWAKKTGLLVNKKVIDILKQD